MQLGSSTPDRVLPDDHVRRPDEVLGYLAHAYTASGLLLVLAAAHLVLAERFAAGIVALVACVVIDATDGNLARRWRVTETASYIDGRRVGAKQAAEGFFLGFPSYWNVVIGYLWLFDTPEVFNTVLLLVLAVLVLAPVRFLYPTQLPERADRRRHYLLGAIWGAAASSRCCCRAAPRRSWSPRRSPWPTRPTTCGARRRPTSPPPPGSRASATHRLMSSNRRQCPLRHAHVCTVPLRALRSSFGDSGPQVVSPPRRPEGPTHDHL